MRLRKKKTFIEQALEQVNDAVDTARPRVESALDSARDFVNDTALPALSDARDKAGPALADARDKAGPALADARAKAAPVVAEARGKAAANLAEARDKAAPLIAQGASVAAERASAARVLADAKVAELKGEPVKKKGKLKKFLLFGAVAGGVALVAKKLQDGAGKDNWQSSYTPAPPPAPVPSAPTPVEDIAGSTPGEAVSDSVETPHAVSTPDDPAEVVDVDQIKPDPLTDPITDDKA